jgi:hypothetical protein
LFDVSTLQILMFFAGLALALATIILSWDEIRSSMRGDNLRPLAFGAGTLIVVFSFLITDITRVYSYPVWLYVFVALGYSLLAGSLMIHKKDYLILFTLVLPIVIPRDSIFFVFVTIPVLWIAHLAYKHFCIVRCTSVREYTVREDRFISDSWALIISMFALLSASYFFLGFHLPVYILPYIAALNIIVKLFTIAIMATLMFRFIRFTGREALVFPIVIGFIIITTCGLFFALLMVTGFVAKEYKEDVADNTKMYKYILDQKYPGDELANKIEQKSPELNDLADKIYIETGVKGVFFLGNFRVAATPSSINGERNIGTQLDDTYVMKSVLIDGHSYTGTVTKLGSLLVASYIPVTKDGKVIGMIATGKTLAGIGRLQSTLTMYVIVGGTITMLIIIGAVFFESRKNLKANSPKKK